MVAAPRPDVDAGRVRRVGRVSRNADALDQREALHALRGPSLPCCPRHRLLYALHKAASRSAWATAHGVALAEVDGVLAGRREPGDTMLAALKLEMDTEYRERRS